MVLQVVSTSVLGNTCWSFRNKSRVLLTQVTSLWYDCEKKNSGIDNRDKLKCFRASALLTAILIKKTFSN